MEGKEFCFAQEWERLGPAYFLKVTDRPLYNKLERKKRDGMFDAARFCRSGNGN